ncbi:Phosphoribosylformylglycinamidine cyclo-ligase [Trichinella spiralis]|uniref:Phosphoribosylformylglycinamidine cyclo-ligase n=1 Tax=Trichinella spiralis TaxID=6334 RepID=A0ABR3KC46_TRISP
MNKRVENFVGFILSAFYSNGDRIVVMTSAQAGQNGRQKIDRILSFSADYESQLRGRRFTNRFSTRQIHLKIMIIFLRHQNKGKRSKWKYCLKFVEPDEVKI